MREAFFASPQLPTLLNAEVIRDTIAGGVSNGMLGYVGKATEGKYEPFINVEVSRDGGISEQKIKETKASLRELSLNEDLQAD